MLTDTHCHIHESSYPLDADDVIRRANAAGVNRLLCVGTSEQSSREAITFAHSHDGVFATVGVHPHDTKGGWKNVEDILSSVQEKAASKVVAVGEVGLDYFYTHSPRATQITAVEAQIDLALRHDLPIIFHVREAFEDFWPLFDNFHDIRGELHSFTDTKEHLEEGLKRGLYIGMNGISTFTKDEAQKAMFASIPIERLLLETDAPFLTPTPFRGRVNEPAFVRNVAEHTAQVRGLPLEDVAIATTRNAHALFAFH
jgi:TatD DNase family protein